MSRTASMTYNPQTGKWAASTKSSVSSGNKSAGAPKAPASTSTPTSGGESNLKASSTDKDQSAGATDKKYNNIELNTLEGQLVFIVTEETIQLKAGDTIKLEGLGKYLSGNYYVVSIERNISTDGYSHSATVIRPNFGDTLKSSGTTTESKGEKQPQEKAPTEKTQSTPAATTTTPKKTYTVKKGDCLWNIAKQQYGSGKSWKKIYDANTGQIVNPNLIYAGQKLVIP